VACCITVKFFSIKAVFSRVFLGLRFKPRLLCGSYKLHEVMAMLEEDDNFVSADIYITPPSQGEVTDEDSGPEDDGGTFDNLARGQLRSTAEAVIQDCDDTRHVGEQDESESSGVDVDDIEQPGNDCDRFVIGLYPYTVWFLENVA